METFLRKKLIQGRFDTQLTSDQYILYLLPSQRLPASSIPPTFTVKNVRNDQVHLHLPRMWR
jgi:hypothetical protein